MFRLVTLAFCALFLAHSSLWASGIQQTPSPSVFSILHDGEKIGRHTVTYRRDGEDLHVDIAIDIEIRVFFIPVFKYNHRNSEIWRGERLISMTTKTNDDGTEYWVKAHATAEGLAVETTDESFIAPADTMPTSYWSKNTVVRSTLLDTQFGRLVEVALSPETVQHIETTAGTIEAQRFDMLGDLTLSLWYTPSGRWVKTAFSVRGTEIEYLLQEQPMRTVEQIRPQ